MKLKYLVISLVVLLFPFFVSAGLTEPQELQYCGGTCPKIIITSEIINDGSGTVSPTVLQYYTSYGNSNWLERKLISSTKNIITYHIWDLTQKPPFSYKIVPEIDGGGIGIPYLPEYGGSIVYSGNCEGIIDVGEIKECSVVMNDGVIPVVMTGPVSTLDTPTTTPAIEQLQQETQVVSPAPVISEDPNIVALQDQITVIQRQIIVVLTQLIQLLQARLVGM